MRKLVLLAIVVSSLVMSQGVSAEQITLRVSTWLASTQEGDMYQRWAEKYMESHPNIKVQFEPTTWDKTLAAAIAGVAPDIIRVQRAAFADMAEKKLIAPIPTEWLGEINANDLFPAIRAQGTYKGRLYGWDPHLGVLLLDYNRTAFDNAGVGYPDHNWTWESLAQAAKKLTIRSADGNTTQWGFHIGYNRPSEMWFLHTWTQGGDIFGPNLKPLFPDSASTKALNYMRKLVLESRVSPPVNQGWTKAFTDGQAAMIIHGTWQNAAFAASTKIALGTSVIPHDTQRATLANLHLWAMSSNTRYPKETWELFKSWVGLQNSLEFTDYGGINAQGLPVWRQALRDPRFHVSTPLKPALDMVDYAHPLPFDPGTGAWFSKTDLVLRQVLLENKPIPEALEELAKEANIQFAAAGASK